MINNPPGVVWKATLPVSALLNSAYPDGGNIQGGVIAVANPRGKGVLLNVRLGKLPKTGGPFCK